ncbi:protein kinase [Micromonospora sp. NPDC049559]|uniref:serine/threonine-protein kinase n=1 Tax=Micromonospora sp. NPDC049559 TaxID=3155923 RepID=UPI00342CC5CD
MRPLYPGGLLARRYRLIDQIGAGGMSVIWRARDEVLDRTVALKVLAPSLAADERFRDMVREEARAAAQLVHPHVTAVHDYGESFAPDGTVISFVVMELLAGEELEARLRDGPLPWAEAVEICAQVAEALAAAHRLGIVHRDVTPANIMMTATGAKVLDFGIATHVGAPDEDEDGATFGTPAYVAPERLDGTPAQPATDAYSLGVLLYETLTGRVPFPAETWDDLTVALRATTVPPPLTGVPGLPPGVAEICLRCLARDPLHRPTAAQVARALRDQLRSPGPPAVPRPTAPGPVGPAVPTPAVEAAAGPEAGAAESAAAPGVAGSAPAGAPPPPARPRRISLRATALGAAMLIGLAVAVPVGLALRGGDGSPRGGPTPAGPGTPSSPTPTAPAGRSSSPPLFAPGPLPDATGATGVHDAIARLDRAIADGVASGDIRDDAGLDLRNQVRNLRSGLRTGSDGLAGEVAGLRDKIAVRVGEGAISAGYAQLLDAALVDVAAAV